MIYFISNHFFIFFLFFWKIRTQTDLWVYYTKQRPPLWIIPAWPIANLCINRMVFFLNILVTKEYQEWWMWMYWLVFLPFLQLLFSFVWHTLDQLLTIFAILTVVLVMVTPMGQYRRAVLIYLCGSGLGYFLELWGTSRRCWTYYTKEMPPLFAIFAHGMAAVAFWKAEVACYYIYHQLSNYFVRFFPQSANWRRII